MSIFRTVEITCPACTVASSFELVMSVSADRRPDLRESILDGSFQREACPRCGATFRVEPEFTYMDIGRGQYIGVWPLAQRAHWQACAAKTRAVFDAALGRDATPEARAIGDTLALRVVFGWRALIEKIIARAADIDDRTLEVAKLAVMRSSQTTLLPHRRALRLIGEREGDLVFAWVGGGPGDPGSALRVPRTLIGEIEADPAAWAAARAAVQEGDLVDFQREMLVA